MPTPPTSMFSDTSPIREVGGGVGGGGGGGGGGRAEKPRGKGRNLIHEEGSCIHYDSDMYCYIKVVVLIAKVEAGGREEQNTVFCCALTDLSTACRPTMN